MGILVIDLRKSIRIMILMIMSAFVLSVVPAQAMAAEVPGIPTGLWVASFEEGAVTLAWAEPADDGGSDIIGYRIYRGIVEDELGILEDVTEMLYTDTGLANGQTYYYAVSAFNAEGEGEKTEILSATPEAEEPHMTEIIIADYTIFTIIYVGEGVYFDIAGGTHTIVVESVTSTNAIMSISWGTQSLTMSEGDSENIDVNGDGKDDFRIKCVKITSDPAEGYPQTAEFSFTTGSFGPGSGTPGFELIAVLIAVALIIFFKRKRI
jgi:hypothetical protein